jgi:hypothetical protein
MHHHTTEWGPSVSIILLSSAPGISTHDEHLTTWAHTLVVCPHSPETKAVSNRDRGIKVDWQPTALNYAHAGEASVVV